ncbi:TRAP transporter TatT component family protein [Thermodesulfobacteriota bacterium]
MKKQTFAIISIIAVFIIFFAGCMKFALKLSPSLFPDLSASFFEECDAMLAKNSMPANLKMLEGLLKSDPANRRILKTLSMGFCGYSMLFVEGDSDERASGLYRRARDYGLNALGFSVEIPHAIDPKKIEALLKKIDKEDIEVLLWTTLSWKAWINLNLDKPAALAQLRSSDACLERMLEADADYLHGLPYILMGISLSARPRIFGGDSEKAREFFEKALTLGKRKFFLAHYYYAKYYAVRIQDRGLFDRLIGEISRGDPGELKEVCLINTVIREKAEELKETADELFY